MTSFTTKLSHSGDRYKGNHSNSRNKFMILRMSSFVNMCLLRYSTGCIVVLSKYTDSSNTTLRNSVKTVFEYIYPIVLICAKCHEDFELVKNLRNISALCA